MKPRHKRLIFISIAVIGLSISALLVLNALQSNIAFFYSPTDIIEDNKAPRQGLFRLGGMVKAGSVHKVDNSTITEFTVTDFKNEIKVEHNGLLPDLFREGQGVIALGQFAEGNKFVAQEVLAKHDENYMPPEVAEALKRSK